MLFSYSAWPCRRRHPATGSPAAIRSAGHPDPAKAAAENPAAEESLSPEEAPAELPAREVTIAMERFKGNEIRLYAENIEPEEAESFTFQWQASQDNEQWVDIPGANSSEYSFKLDGISSSFYWRLIVSEK